MSVGTPVKSAEPVCEGWEKDGWSNHSWAGHYDDETAPHNPPEFWLRRKCDKGENCACCCCGIRIVFCKYDTMLQIDHDAHLITAAPDMLRALEFAYLTIEHRDGIRHRLDLFTKDEREKLAAAIRKAKGES